MLTDAQKAVLTSREAMEYDTNQWVYVRVIIESLADARIKSEARRKMLKKCHWGFDKDGRECGIWCGNLKTMNDTPDCALEALLAEEE